MVDALCSGRSVRKDVLVRIQSWAQKTQRMLSLFYAMYIVYILYSSVHDKYYVGQTNDIADRIRRHNGGFNASTSPYRPWVIQLTITKSTRSEAMLLEKKLKNLSKDRLLKFIEKYGCAGADEA